MCISNKLNQTTFQYLRSHRCLLILDKPGYQGYGKLLRQIAEVPHQSCLLLTSRETPQEIAIRQGKNQPIRCLELNGFHELDGRKF